MVHNLIEKELVKLACIFHLEYLNIRARPTSLIFTGLFLGSQSLENRSLSGMVGPISYIVGGGTPKVIFIGRAVPLGKEEHLLHVCLDDLHLIAAALTDDNPTVIALGPKVFLPDV